MNEALLPDPSEAEVRTQLERILSSESFSQSESLQRFLRYVVEQALAGRGDQLKEYNIGVDVLYWTEHYTEDPRSTRST